MILKKILKIFLMSIFCIMLLFAALVSFIIVKDSTPQRNLTSVADVPETESEYISTQFYDAFQVADTNAPNITIHLSASDNTPLPGALHYQESDFRMAKYYALDQALNLYEISTTNKLEETSLLTDGKLDAEKLFQQVMHNNCTVTQDGKNSLNPFYSDLDNSQILSLCHEIAEVINQAPQTMDIPKVANTLENLTIFQQKGSSSNAFVSTKLAFVYNPGMIELYRKKQTAEGKSPDTVLEQVITHEIMHLIQHGANDGNDDNGIEIGFCRMYNLPNAPKTLPVDTLYYTWILEAGAELGMTDYLGVAPGTYQKKISYARSYNLSRFYEIGTKEQALENLSFRHTPEEVFTSLNLTTEQEQIEFLKFMYSIEITQTDPEDFFTYYEAQTGRVLTEDEKTGLRMDIRTDAIKYLTRNFLKNIVQAINDEAVKDSNTLFYLLRLWELDTFNHLQYTQHSSLAHANDFILWYDQIQTLLLTEIAKSISLSPEKMLQMYSEYHLQSLTATGEIIDNCSFDTLTAHMQNYILSARNYYVSSTYSSIKDVADWLKAKERRDQTAASYE